MFDIICNEELMCIEGGINGFKVFGGVLMLTASIGGCFAGAGAASVPGIIGGGICILEGLNE